MLPKKVIFSQDIFLAGHQRHKDDACTAEELDLPEWKLKLLLKERVCIDSELATKDLTEPVAEMEEPTAETKKAEAAAAKAEKAAAKKAAQQGAK